MSHFTVATGLAIAALALTASPTTGPGSSAAADHTYPVSSAASSAAADRYIQDTRGTVDTAHSRRLPAPYLPTSRRPPGY